VSKGPRTPRGRSSRLLDLGRIEAANFPVLVPTHVVVLCVVPFFIRVDDVTSRYVM
jgi:hypothetical protein